MTSFIRFRLYMILSLIAIIPILAVSCGDDPPGPPDLTPTDVSAVNGDRYKAVMGSSATDQPMEFFVSNKDGEALSSQWVHFRRLIGDGSLVTDSAQTDASGKVTCEYTFDGAFGNATISAFVRDVDTVMVEVRANTLIPGTTGQGQYILMQDEYSDVIEWLGTPERVDSVSGYWLFVAVYESSMGVALLIEDSDQSGSIDGTDEVLEVFVNGIYSGNTADSIGIGSTRAQFSAAYGVVPGVYDPDPPPAYYYDYPNEGLLLYTDTNSVEADRQVFEIHITASTPPPPTAKTVSGQKADLEAAETREYRIRR